jgi:nucleotide-binding universal stress UspA family protein
MIKTVLVLSQELPGFEPTLVVAAEVGRRFAAHIDVLHIQADPLSMVPFGADGLSATMLEEMRKAAEAAIEERMAEMRAVYDRVFGATGVSTSWHVAIGGEPEIAAAAGRLRDLTVLGRPDDSGDVPWRTTLQALLFNSGRPVLLLPLGEPPPRFGDRVAVAWNGSAQAAHAVAAAPPWLRAATDVTILSAGPVDPHASTAGLITCLARHDIQAAAREFEPHHVPIGKALLEQSHQLQADLLVMGAYGHSRLREVILGGATREILAAADLPVLMAH